MKLQMTMFALGLAIGVNACEKKEEQMAAPAAAPTAADAVPPAQPAAGQPVAAGEPAAVPPAGQPAAAAMDAAGRDKAHMDLQTKFAALTQKYDALKMKVEAPTQKRNEQLTEQLKMMQGKMDATRTDLTALKTVPETSWAAAKSNVEKNIQELEVSLEQAQTRAVN